MSNFSKSMKAEHPLKSGGLLAGLLLLCVGVAFVISRSGHTTGILAVSGVVGLGIAAFTLIYPLFGFYVCLVGAFFIFDAIRFLKTDAPLVSGIDVMVYIMFIGVLINKVVKKEAFWKNIRGPILFMYGIIIVYYLIEFFNPNAVSHEIYFLLFRRFITLMLFFYCTVQLFTDYNRIAQFLKIYLGLAFFAGLYGVYQKWVGMPKYELDYFLNDEGAALGMLDNGELRIASFLPDCTAFGLLMSASIIMALAFALNMKTTFNRKVLLFTAVIIMSFAMSYSGTRTATMMLIVEVVLYILMTSTQRKTIVFAVFFGMVLMAILFAPSYGNGTLNRLKSTFESEDESLKVRDVNREYIQPYIYSHPIGGGVGSTGVVYLKYNTGHPLAGFPTDSGLLAMVLEFGWIGLIIQCLTYFIILQQGIRGYYRSRNHRFRLVYLASTLAIFGYILAQYSQVAIGQIPGGFLFFSLIAAIIRLRQIEATSTTDHLNPQTI